MTRQALLQNPSDPYAGDHWFPDLPSNYENHLSYSCAPCLSEEEYAVEDEQFLAHYVAHLSGQPCLEALLSSAGRLGVSREVKHDRRPARVAPSTIDNGVLCDILENEVPDLLPVAADTVLGPFADTTPDSSLLQAAIAALSHSVRIPSGQLALTRWHRHSPGEPRSLRASIRCLERIPTMLWSLKSQTWKPLLPLSAAYRPLDTPEASQIASLAPGAVTAVVARLLPVADGRWIAIGAIGLPAIPPIGPLKDRLLVELARHRRHERRANWEDLLRHHPEVLYRTCTTWCWHHLEETS